MRSIEPKRMWAGLLMMVMTVVHLTASAQAPDAQEILRRSDLARGGGHQLGLAWEIKLVNTGTGSEDQPSMTLDTRANRTSSLAEVREPASSRGGKMLQVDRNMWLSKPGLKKPIAISPRMRFSGQAAIGDIAATNYAKDYHATYAGEETIAGERCHVLELASINNQSTYERIRYWISQERSVAVKAQFFSVSGRLLKQAVFEYGNTIRYGDEQIPFVSVMRIDDATTDARTTLTYDKLEVRGIANAEFDVDNL